MRINKIKFFNYKPYFGEQIFEFPRNGKIIIVKGENGAGKTTFINGLTWAMFKEKTAQRDLFNDSAVFDAPIDTIVKMFIELHFEHENKMHILKREISGKKISDDYLEFEEKYYLEIIYEGKQQKINDELKIENYINNILNESVKSYFFFDAAKIENFTKEDHYKDVEVAIKNLLKIETVKRAKDHIHIVVKEIQSSIKGDNQDEINTIQEEINMLDEEIDNVHDEIDNLNNEITAVDRDIEKTLDELDHIEKNSSYKIKKEGYLATLNQKNELFNKTEIDINEFLGKAYQFFSDRLINDSQHVIRKKSADEQKIAAKSALREFIKESISKGSCYLCEESISNETHEKLLLKLPSLLNDKAYFNNLISLSSNLIIAKNLNKSSYQALIKLKQQYNEIQTEITELNILIKECELNINKELPDTNEYKDMLKKLQALKNQKLDEKREYDQTLLSLSKEKKQKEEDHLSLTKQNEKYKEEQKKLELCYSIREEIDRIFNIYETTEIEKINQETKKIFDSIIRKNNVFSNVFIDKSYRLNVSKTNTVRNVLKDLSYGERQILSLSLIFALAKVSGDQGPFVMDTPMGNLDPIHRKKLLRNAVFFVHQMILLVTSSEFTEDLYEICNDEISAIYRLDDSSKGLTKAIKER